jgi:hypothetical protein
MYLEEVCPAVGLLVTRFGVLSLPNNYGNKTAAQLRTTTNQFGRANFCCTTFDECDSINMIFKRLLIALTGEKGARSKRRINECDSDVELEKEEKSSDIDKMKNCPDKSRG